MSDAALMEPLNQVPPDWLGPSGTRLEGSVRAAQGASGDKRQSELKKVSQEFEAIFIAQMLKVMRETIEESGLLEGGFGSSIYTELFDQEVSLSFARRGTLGISDLLYRSLVDNLPQDGEEGEKQKIGKTTGAERLDNMDNPIADLQLPVQAPVSSGFGVRTDPFTHNLKFHKGVDLAAPRGMKVVAALPGRILFAGYENGYGNTVLIQHEDGIQTRYGHLGEISVRVGDSVSQESNLGTVGDSGRSTGPHLHFEVIRMGRPLDPASSFSAHRTAPRPQGFGDEKLGG
jgi:murein DD-endopeptidase MepM/ murein hydrolase activator NlpD